MTIPTPPVPDLSEDWIASRREYLVHELTVWPSRWPTRNLTIGAAATVAAATAAAAVFLVAGPAARPAFAGWKPTPTAATAGQTQSAEAACRQHIAAAGSASAGSTTKPVKAIDPSSLQLALTDTRGPYSMLVFDGDAQVICLAGPSLNSITGAAPSSSSVPAGQIAVGRVSYDAHSDPGQLLTMIEGHTGAGVSAVRLQLDDGSSVDTTVTNGWFAAWWPNSQGIASATITTPTGAQTQTLNIPGPQFPQDPGTK